MVICLACLAVCGIVVAPASATTQANGVVMATPALAPCVEHVYTKRKSGPPDDVVNADREGNRGTDPPSYTWADTVSTTLNTDDVIVLASRPVVKPCEATINADTCGLAGRPPEIIMATGQNTIEVVAITC